jgi:hypothetical protein
VSEQTRFGGRGGLEAVYRLVRVSSRNTSSATYVEEPLATSAKRCSKLSTTILGTALMRS